MVKYMLDGMTAAIHKDIEAAALNYKHGLPGYTEKYRGAENGFIEGAKFAINAYVTFIQWALSEHYTPLTIRNNVYRWNDLHGNDYPTEELFEKFLNKLVNG